MTTNKLTSATQEFVDKHKKFLFPDNDYSCFTEVSEWASGEMIKSLNTDIHVIRNHLLIKPGLSTIIVNINGNTRVVDIETKTSCGYNDTEIKFISIDREKYFKRTRVTVDSDLVRIDRLINLECEIWIPKSLLVGGSHLSDGQYKVLHNTTEIGRQYQTEEDETNSASY